MNKLPRDILLMIHHWVMHKATVCELPFRRLQWNAARRADHKTTYYLNRDVSYFVDTAWDPKRLVYWPSFELGPPRYCTCPHCIYGMTLYTK